MCAPKESLLTGKIVDWDQQKRYGYLQVGKQRVFLHIQDFAEYHKKPEVGDRIHFVMGQDSEGRSCAKNAVHANDGGRLTVLNLFILAGLLVLPAIALQRSPVDFRWSGGYFIVLGTLTYGAYALDKKRARDRDWRLSEALLHLMELIGGWPGAFLAQRRLRHKCSKRSFQFVFWLIVLVYQFAAFDSLQKWQISRAVLDRIGHTSVHSR